MKTTLAHLAEACGGTVRDRQNQRRIIAWSFLWMASWVALVRGIDNEWMPAGWPVALAVALTLLPAALTLLAYRRFLREADELRRKIELDALALAFGVGVVGGMSYFALGRAGVVAMDDFLSVILAMVATHSLGVWIGHRRYS